MREVFRSLVKLETDISLFYHYTFHHHLINEEVRQKFDQSAFVNALRLCKAAQCVCASVCVFT